MEAKYTLVVMDYCAGNLKLYHFVDKEPEDPEEWLELNTDYKSSQCYWMLVKGEPQEEHKWILNLGQKES